MVAGLVIKTGHQLAQVGVVTATEKFAFQQPPKHRQRRCILLFHMRGLATQSAHIAQSPVVVRRALGTSSLAEADDRSLLHDSKAAIVRQV